LSAQVVRLIRQLGALKAQAPNVSAPGIEWSSYALLFHLDQHGPMRSSALAESVCADPSTVSRQAATLVEQGLVERRPDPADRRAVQLAVTARGAALFAEMRAQREAMFDTVLRDWSDEDIERLTELLTRFTSDLERRRPSLLKNLMLQENR
jgi:DNA-binding MarR family transcriptional regulator